MRPAEAMTTTERAIWAITSAIEMPKVAPRLTMPRPPARKVGSKFIEATLMAGISPKNSPTRTDNPSVNRTSPA